MSQQWWEDDDQLLAALREAFRSARSVPAEFTATAKATFAWRDIDAELATLTWDSISAGAGAELAGQRADVRFRGTNSRDRGDRKRPSRAAGAAWPGADRGTDHQWRRGHDCHQPGRRLHHLPDPTRPIPPLLPDDGRRERPDQLARAGGSPRRHRRSAVDTSVSVARRAALMLRGHLFCSSGTAGNLAPTGKRGNPDDARRHRHRQA
jgi:hypothetical protein